MKLVISRWYFKKRLLCYKLSCLQICTWCWDNRQHITSDFLHVCHVRVFRFEHPVCHLHHHSIVHVCHLSFGCWILCPTSKTFFWFVYLIEKINIFFLLWAETIFPGLEYVKESIDVCRSVFVQAWVHACPLVHNVNHACTGVGNLFSAKD